jgi:hypothetical protein
MAADLKKMKAKEVVINSFFGLLISSKSYYAGG